MKQQMNIMTLKDRAFVGIGDHFERLMQPFRVAPTVVIPVGDYSFVTARVRYNFGLQRSISGNLLVERGRFYDGERTAISFRPARLNPTAQLSIEPSASVTWIDLPSGSFRQTLVGPRVIYTMTPRLFASALMQYNSTGTLVGSNMRLRWEYQPGSELFVVFNEERDARARGWPALENRSLIVNVNRRLRLRHDRPSNEYGSSSNKHRRSDVQAPFEDRIAVAVGGRFICGLCSVEQ